MRFSTALSVLAAATLSATTAFAETKYPDAELPGTIRVIVAYKAGGSSDALARVTLPKWEEALETLTGKSTNAVVVNLPGAGGEVGWTSLRHAQPDGSTIGIVNLPAVPIVEAARDAGFEPWLENFTALGVNVIDPSVIRLSSKSKHGSLQEAIDAAKEDPGSVVVGADGPLSDDHVALYALQKATGAKFAFLPFPGSSPANTAFLAGEVDIAIGNAFDHVKTAEAAAEAVILQDEPYELIPDVPTIADHLKIDLGSLGSTRGFAGPAGMPEDLVTVYREAFAMAFADSDYQAEARKRNITLVTPIIGDDFTALMQREQATAQDLLDLFIEGGFIAK